MDEENKCMECLMNCVIFEKSASAVNIERDM